MRAGGGKLVNLNGGGFGSARSAPLTHVQGLTSDCEPQRKMDRDQPPLQPS